MVMLPPPSGPLARKFGALNEWVASQMCTSKVSPVGASVAMTRNEKLPSFSLPVPWKVARVRLMLDYAFHGGME